MELPIYQIDAFTGQVFGGNPACVVPLKEWLPDELLLNIAKENAVAETAYFIPKGDSFHLRWFTPEIEMDLCGHATLATAHVIRSSIESGPNQMSFDTNSGLLQVTYADGLYQMELPSRVPELAMLPQTIQDSLNIQPQQVLKSRDYVLVYENEEDIKNIKVDPSIFNRINLDPGGVIVTAPGKSCDFVSRFFTPQASILEDPVTGSAHCSLVPYWANRLNKKSLHAFQLSERKGELFCEDLGDKVLVSGRAMTYMKGFIDINNTL